MEERTVCGTQNFPSAYKFRKRKAQRENPKVIQICKGDKLALLSGVPLMPLRHFLSFPRKKGSKEVPGERYASRLRWAKFSNPRINSGYKGRNTFLS